MNTNPRIHRPAFTLIELMAVIVIIVILAGMVVGGLGYVNEKQARSKAQVQIALISKALEEYKLDMGAYPATGNTANGLTQSARSLYTNLFFEGWDYVKKGSPATWTKKVGAVDVPKATRIYLSDLDPISSKQGWIDTQPIGDPRPNLVIKDPWGNEYRYRTARDDGGSANSHTQNPDFDLWSVGKDTRTHQTANHADNRDDVK